MAAAVTAFGDAAGFVGVVTEVVVVEFDPFVPLHGAEAHSDVVGAVAKGTVREWWRSSDGPVGVGWGFGTLERRWRPG